jgi:uncharacterized membrane protein
MATLLAITYPEPDRAKQAMASVDWSDFDRQINVKDACWISKQDGEFAVHPWRRPTAGKAALGGALGLLVGGLFALPVVGLAAGTIVGIHKARQHVDGLDDEFVASVASQLESGGSAIVVLFDEGAHTARAAADLARFGGTVHSTDLSPEQLARFQARLEQATQGAAAAGNDPAAES